MYTVKGVYTLSASHEKATPLSWKVSKLTYWGTLHNAHGYVDLLFLNENETVLRYTTSFDFLERYQLMSKVDSLNCLSMALRLSHMMLLDLCDIGQK